METRELCRKKAVSSRVYQLAVSAFTAVVILIGSVDSQIAFQPGDVVFNCSRPLAASECVCYERPNRSRSYLVCRASRRVSTVAEVLGEGTTDIVVSDTPLANVSSDAFRKSSSTLLNIQIELSINLVSISETAFAGLTSLATLEISRCINLAYIEENVFDPLVNLLTLNLMGNNLRAVSTCQFQNLSKLQRLDLSSNQLQDLAPGTFANLHQLTQLFLDDNFLRSLVPETFFLLPNTTIAKLHLSLSANPFTCDCKVLWLHWLVLDTTNHSPFLSTPGCTSPSSLAGKNLKDLKTTDMCTYRTPRILHRVGSVTRGQTTSLTCASFISAKRPLYYWYKDGRYQDEKLDNPRYHFFYGVLTIENVTSDDGGTWTCYVTDPQLNPAGLVKSTAFVLNVKSEAFCGHPVPDGPSEAESSEVGQWVGVGLGVLAFGVVAGVALYCLIARLDGGEMEAGGKRDRMASDLNLPENIELDDITPDLTESPEYLKYMSQKSTQVVPTPLNKDTSTRFNATIPLASGDGGMSQEHQGGTSNIDGTSRVPLDVFAEVG